MRLALILSVVGFTFMAIAVSYGFAAGGGWPEVAKLWALPWGKVSFADVYTGFALFCGWVIYREKNVGLIALWLILILTLGNVISCLYVAIALFRAKGDWASFWLGDARR